MGNVISFKKTQRLQNIRLRDNLIRLMKQHKTNMTHLYKETGVPITTIQRICKDPNANPTLASLMPIADFFSITLAQLIGEDPLPSNQPNDAVVKQWANIPIISWQQAVNWPNIAHSSSELPRIATEITVNKNAFALEITEDHWEQFHRGSVVIVEPELEPVNRDYVITHKADSQQANLKQILLHENDKYLKPMNSDFKTTLMDDSYQILGVVVQVRMNLK